MVASNARDVLKKENELLNKLAESASTFTQGLTEVQAAVLNDWVVYFKGWRQINDDLMAMTDEKLDQELNEEMERLKNFRNSLTGNSAAAEFYRKKVFDVDIADAKRLLTGV
jgi:uncharacterized phage infection (PIP) family protein YhgE